MTVGEKLVEPEDGLEVQEIGEEQPKHSDITCCLKNIPMARVSTLLLNNSGVLFFMI